VPLGATLWRPWPDLLSFLRYVLLLCCPAAAAVWFGVVKRTTNVISNFLLFLP
jgi:hypothetical protein